MFTLLQVNQRFATGEMAFKVTQSLAFGNDLVSRCFTTTIATIPL